ncbi:MAG: DUF899 family protein [Pseudomonadota bacterium]
MTESTMTNRETWLRARLELLESEKALARQADQVAAQRRALPRVRIDTHYVFQSEDGARTLSELFGPYSQLIVMHFMFSPEAESGCPICSFWADGYNPMIAHMNQRDTQFVVVSRAPIERLLAYRQRMGWTFNWVSTDGNRFNYDFDVSATDEEMASGETTYNYRTIQPYAQDLHGTSVFCKDDDVVYHTYSTYARGVERMNAAYGFLDLLPNGRNESGLPFSMAWVRRHDEYEI